MSNPEEIRDEIIDTINKIWGIKTYSFEESNKGYKNLKWKLDTDRGPLFVKQYNWQRYNNLDNVRIALNYQVLLNRGNIPCPRIIDSKGILIQETPSGERFVLTDFCNGKNVHPGKVNTEQMYHLGQATGRMHLILNTGSSISKQLDWNLPTKDKMLSNWNKRWQQATVSNSKHYISALEKQKKIIDTMDLSIFDKSKKGLVHWDLWVDNLLFNENSLSAILDFDRLSYIYPEFDISRAILSCTLLYDELNIAAANAFLKGYTESIPLLPEDIVRSIKLTWWKEAEWVGVNAEKSGPIERFVEESIWISNNWYNLKDLFC
jgi:homoserine kinase type II